MTAEKIEQWPIDKLIPYARNSRTHSEDQIAQIAASIKEFGFTNPVLIDGGGGIIAGHGRVLAARKLDITKVPCIKLEHLTDTQKRAYVIADNKLALSAGWDYEMLRIEIQELEDKFQLDIVGFSTFEIGDILGLNEMEQKPTTGEINPNEFNMDHKCPKCGFEFDE
jgi:ParB-like chromosome segregation protein Spo0J